MTSIAPSRRNHVSNKATRLTESVPRAIVSDELPRYVSLRVPGCSFDRDELRAAFNAQTKAILIFHTDLPTGKVFTRDDMEFIASLCQEHDALCFTDEMYEHILYPR